MASTKFFAAEMYSSCDLNKSLIDVLFNSNNSLLTLFDNFAPITNSALDKTEADCASKLLILCLSSVVKFSFLSLPQIVKLLTL